MSGAMLKRWITRFELPEFIEVHAVVERHGSSVFSFEQSHYIWWVSTRQFLAAVVLIKKRKCPATKEWRANGRSTDKRKWSRFCHEISLELARNESNMKMDTTEDCEGASWIFFALFLHKQSRKLFSSVTNPSNIFLEIHFTSQPFSLIIVSISSVLLWSLNYFFRKSVSI